MIFVSNDHTIRKFGQDGEPLADSGTRLLPVSHPGHCGEDMQLTIQSSAAAGHSLPPGLDDPVPDLHLVWQCRCGFRLDTQPEPTYKVWAPMPGLKPVSENGPSRSGEKSK
jgi:hypothetical protein